MAELMRRDPHAAVKMFDMVGGADKLLTQMQTRHSSQELAESMTRLRAQQGADPSGDFNYTGFVQEGLTMGVPLGQLSAAVNAIAAGEQVNLPDISETIDYKEDPNGQALRRRVWYDRDSGKIIQAGQWSPAFAPGTSRSTRVNPDGSVEIFEGMTPLQQSKVAEQQLRGEKGVQDIMTLIGMIDTNPGVVGVPGRAASFGAAMVGSGARMINAIVGEELVNPEDSEQAASQRLAGITPEQRSRFETLAIGVETSVRESMKLGKPSNADLALVTKAVKALSSVNTPGSIRASLWDLAVAQSKYEYLKGLAIGHPMPYALHTLDGVAEWRDMLINSGMPMETAHQLSEDVYTRLTAREFNDGLEFPNADFLSEF
jgi:hypothetical protein